MLNITHILFLHDTDILNYSENDLEGSGIASMFKQF